MKNLIRIIAVVLILLAAFLIIYISACNSKSGKSETHANYTISATGDEGISIQMGSNAVEESPNVNGMRFTSTLAEFTTHYNEAKKALNETDYINMDKWRKHGAETTDDNGVKIQYYYYDDDNTNFTATVEIESKKILNIGFGTTMSYYMGRTENLANSDIALEKAALMAQSVCLYPKGSTDIIKEIFRKTTTTENDILWYQGCVYKLDTQEDQQDSKNNIMLFRIFPVTENLRAEWNLKEYII